MIHVAYAPRQGYEPMGRVWVWGIPFGARVVDGHLLVYYSCVLN